MFPMSQSYICTDRLCNDCYLWDLGQVIDHLRGIHDHNIFIRRPSALGFPDSHGNFWYCFGCDTKLSKDHRSFKSDKAMWDHLKAWEEVQDVAMDLITLKSSSRLDSGLKSFLPEAVGKLGRYYSISYELVCAARSREYSIFNRIAIEAYPIRRPSQPSNVGKNFHPLTALQNILRPRNAVQSKALRPCRDPASLFLRAESRKVTTKGNMFQQECMLSL
jgi:hypothetical protein